MTTSTRPRAQALLSALVLASGLLAVQPAALAADPAYTDPSVIKSDPITLETGHIDAFNPVATGDGQIQLALKEDVTGSGVLHTPESVTLKVKESAHTAIPDGYPGAPGGYLLPLTQNPDLIWPGWDTMHAGAAVGVTDLNAGRADITISDVQGPGDVYIFSQSGFGALKSLLTDGGYQLPGTIHQDGLAHVHTNWVFTEPGRYSLTVSSTVWNAEEPARTATSQTATYTFEVGTFAKVAVTGAPEGHAHSGSPIEFTAAGENLPEGAAYRWEVKRADQSDFEAVEGQSGSSYTLTAEQALNAAQVRVSVLSGNEAVATSEPVTLEVDDHGAAPLQKAAVSGLADHYHPGDDVSLSASVSPASVVDTWAWYVTNPGESEVQVEGADSSSVTLEAGTAVKDGATVRAALVKDDGTVYVASDPVTVAVEDHEEPAATVAIQGAPDGAVQAGETVTLSAAGENLPEGAAYRWEVKRAGQSDFEAVEGQSGASYALIAGQGLDGAQVRVSVLSGDELVATSEPVTLEVEGAEPDEPEAPAESELTDATRGGVTAPATAEQGSTITLDVGAAYAGQAVTVWLHSDPVLLAESTTVNAAGAVSVTIPADTEVAGHKISVQDADGGALIGWAPLEVTAADEEPSPDPSDAPSSTPSGSDTKDGAKQDQKKDGLADTGAGTEAALAAAALLALSGAATALAARSRRRRG
ncbi:MAG: choice-of-anchor M domain-containing protein [Actinomyces sp.]|jgi:surface-anchored protein|nr:choice-of-anchor M domain-containing protein [Actinomyces sp.]MCI1788930.1 choice-of-anchor M domain-containing protein [Actinomyces sp.]MCI1830036.1 choice-of-anchor M domain-containing protein [Actinomyces sp.]